VIVELVFVAEQKGSKAAACSKPLEIHCELRLLRLDWQTAASEAQCWREEQKDYLLFGGAARSLETTRNTRLETATMDMTTGCLHQIEKAEAELSRRCLGERSMHLWKSPCFESRMVGVDRRSFACKGGLTRISSLDQAVILTRQQQALEVPSSSGEARGALLSPPPQVLEPA
jgi:hypothetical protein